MLAPSLLTRMLCMLPPEPSPHEGKGCHIPVRAAFLLHTARAACRKLPARAFETRRASHSRRSIRHAGTSILGT